jgi:hypothetical protein
MTSFLLDFVGLFLTNLTDLFFGFNLYVSLLLYIYYILSSCQVIYSKYRIDIGDDLMMTHLQRIISREIMIF